jgi:acetyl-CoA C-acetyltransferase
LGLRSSITGVVSAVRTAIGTFGGSLKDTPPTALGALVVRESLARAGVPGSDVGHVVFGHVVNTEPRDMYLSRVAAIDGGCDQGTPAFNVNRLCGSGLQAIVSAAQSILLGDCRDRHRRRRREHEPRTLRQPEHALGRAHGRHQLVDMMVGALHDPFHNIHMGVTAENVAAKYGISREDQDRLAWKATRAPARHRRPYFKDQIVPVSSRAARARWCSTPTSTSAPTHAGDMAKLKPAF